VGDSADTVVVIGGDGVILGVNVGKGVIISLGAIDELVHEDKISKNRQSTLLMKMRFVDFII